MKRQLLANVLVLIGIGLFNILFWKTGTGLNFLIFSVFTIGALYTLNPEAIKSKTAVAATIGTLITAIFYVYNNSLSGKMIHILSTWVMVGFIQQRELRFLGYAFGLTIWNTVTSPIRYLKELTSLGGTLTGVKGASRYLRLAGIPIFFVFVFFAIYYTANETFANFADGFISFIGEWIFEFSFERVIFTLLSMAVVGGLLWKPTVKLFQELETDNKDILVRDRMLSRYIPKGRKMTALKDEYSIALMMLIGTNLLLFLVNILDISYVWTGFKGEDPAELVQYVYEGTYLLIFAILLAMGILLYFFRRNINFLPNNKWLTYAAYIWIVQNAILTFSVGVRNYQYIAHHGLAYKRIGVMIFLSLVLFGLVTMFLKIKEKRTVYNLMRVNSWALYAAMVGICLINWDGLITNYNIQHNSEGTIDVPFLYREVSDINLPILHKNQDKIAKNAPNYSKDLNYLFERKRDNFIRRYEQQNWRAWNYADYRTMKYLKSVKQYSETEPEETKTEEKEGIELEEDDFIDDDEILDEPEN